jgi:hypothetical protein
MLQIARLKLLCLQESNKEKDSSRRGYYSYRSAIPLRYIFSKSTPNTLKDARLYLVQSLFGTFWTVMHDVP